MTVMTMTDVHVGSAVAEYKTFETVVVTHSFKLYIDPIKMSVSTMSDHCRRRYKHKLSEELHNISSRINYKLCTKSMCSYVTGSAEKAVVIHSTDHGDVNMYVAINSSGTTDEDVKLDFIPSTVMHQLSAFQWHFQHFGK